MRAVFSTLSKLILRLLDVLVWHIYECRDAFRNWAIGSSFLVRKRANKRESSCQVVSVAFTNGLELCSKFIWTAAGSFKVDMDCG